LDRLGDWHEYNPSLRFYWWLNSEDGIASASPKAVVAFVLLALLPIFEVFSRSAKKRRSRILPLIAGQMGMEYENRVISLVFCRNWIFSLNFG